MQPCNLGSDCWENKKSGENRWDESPLAWMMIYILGPSLSYVTDVPVPGTSLALDCPCWIGFWDLYPCYRSDWLAGLWPILVFVTRPILICLFRYSVTASLVREALLPPQQSFCCGGSPSLIDRCKRYNLHKNRCGYFPPATVQAHQLWALSWEKFCILICAQQCTDIQNLIPL